MTSMSEAYSAVCIYVNICRLCQEICKENCVLNRVILGPHGQMTELFHMDKWTVNVIDKAVFCVDNLNSSVNEQKLRDFVQKELGVKVLSCFETKPRRWRSEASQNVNRVAFRLCIDSADCDRLLTSNKWPNSVTISEWYFIKPFRENRRQQTDWQQEREQVITGELLLTDTRPKNTTPAAIEAAGSSTELTDAVADADTDIAETDMEEMETTIVYNDGSTTTTAGV